ncbi:phosphotransferase [Stackebrandtia soli]|uniref:phosphotransferase n=1 Tax=Stackebrandtia soli TaxID=1892856 RepID=UPI0039E83700
MRVPSDLVEHVAERWGVDDPAWEPILGAGEECLVWALPEAEVVVRAAARHRSTSALRGVYRTVARLGTAVPEVCAPMLDRDGESVSMWSGHPVSLWPLVSGRHIDHRDDDRVAAAAALLARLHAASAAVDDLHPGPVDPPIWPEPLRDALLDERLDALSVDAAYSRGIVHGDFYPRNILDDPHGMLNLIDWDELHTDWYAAETAWAIWEFTHDRDTGLVDMSRARRFLAAYTAAGGQAIDWPTITVLIRRRLRREIADAFIAGTADSPYTRKELAAFDQLAKSSQQEHEPSVLQRIVAV